jgi:hypothetical protein
MGVDQQDVESESVHEGAKAVDEVAGVVAVAQDTGDLTGSDARGDQVDRTAAARWRDVMRDVGDRDPLEEEVVQRGRDLAAMEPEQHVDPRGLDVGSTSMQP